jgi:hypothetical protein
MQSASAICGFSKYLAGFFPAPAPPAFLGIAQIEYLRLSL